jgi:hypothetical protein
MAKTTSSTCIAVFGVIVVLLFTSAPPSSAQSSDPSAVILRFVGTWQEDDSKADVAGAAHLRFQQNAAGILEEARGPEVNPMLQPVVFDGKPHDVSGGGANPNGLRTVWKQVDDRTFERGLLDGAGRVMNKRRLSISPDGKTLTQQTDIDLSDGRTVTTTATFSRIAGGPQGLVGRWKQESFKTTAPFTFRYEAAGANGLKFSAQDGASWTLKLDDQPVPMTAPTAIPDTAIAAKVIDDYTIEFRQGRQGQLLDKDVRTISKDGKTITSKFTMNRAEGGSTTGVRTYVKQ